MRQWVFRWRGYVLLPAVLLVILTCRPTAASLALGLGVAVLGETLRIWGVGYTGVTTRHSQVVAPRLITAGPYAYVRNPLYLGNVITALGFLVVAVGGIGWGLRLALFAVMLLFYGFVYGIIIPLEEEFLETQFGDEYAAYKSEVPRVLPRSVPYARAQGTFDWAAIKRGEIHTLALFGLVAAFMLARLLWQCPLWVSVMRELMGR